MKKYLLSIFTLISPILIFAQETTSDMSMDERIETWFKPISDVVTSIVFYPITIVGKDVPIVIIILLLIVF